MHVKGEIEKKINEEKDFQGGSRRVGCDASFLSIFHLPAYKDHIVDE